MEECRGKEEEEENDRGGNGRDEFPEVIFAAEGFKFRHDRGVVCISYDVSKLYTWRISILLYSPVQFPQLYIRIDAETRAAVDHPKEERIGVYGPCILGLLSLSFVHRLPAPTTPIVIER